MRRSFWSAAVLFFSVAWCVTSYDRLTAESPRTSDGGVKRALLIGINKYRAVPKLQGSLNDIEQ